MTYQQFKHAHDMASPAMCGEFDDVASEVTRRKQLAFNAFMSYLDTNHPRKKASTMPAYRTHQFKSIISWLKSQF